MKAACIVVCLLLLGCGTPRRDGASAPSATVETEHAKVTQSGDAKEPASASVNTSKTSVTIPARSFLAWEEVKPGRWELHMSADTPLVMESRTESVKAPVAFAPPAPVTPKEEKDAAADFWTVIGMRAGLVIGAGAFLFGLLRDYKWLLVGGMALAGGCALGLFWQQHPILSALLIGGGLVAGFAGPYFWHRYVKHSQPAK